MALGLIEHWAVRLFMCLVKAWSFGSVALICAMKVYGPCGVLPCLPV